MKRFPSIKSNADFRAVYKMGKSYADRLLVMYVCDNNLDRNRIGISASKKIGNSVTRHRMVRLLREAFRLNNEGVEKGYDIVVVVREAAADEGYHSISESYTKLLRKHGIMLENDIN